MMKMEHDMKIIDGHVHLVQYIAGTGAGGELRFAGNGMAEYASGERCCSREITLVSRISIPWKQ